MKPLLFIALLSLFGKNTSEIRIPYRQLTWSDYRGNVPENEPSIAARTFTQIEYETEQQGGKYYFRVLVYFVPDSSFVRIKSEATLRHEQTHFKIACIEAKRCNLAMAPMQGGDSIAEVAASALYDHCFEQASRKQDLFDLETNHSLNLEAEKRWEDRVSRELRNFETLSPKIHGRNR